MTPELRCPHGHTLRGELRILVHTEFARLTTRTVGITMDALYGVDADDNFAYREDLRQQLRDDSCET